MTSPRPFLARMAMLGLIALALWEIATLLRIERDAASDEDWRAAAAVVRESRAPDDLVVFAPEWVEPVGRLWLGDLIPIADAARMDAARYDRVWEVSIRGAEAREVHRAQPVYEAQLGAVRVRRFDRAAPTIAWDSRQHGEVREVGYGPRDCVLLPIRRAGEKVRLRYADVPLGRELHVAAGLADSRARRDNHATARLEVHVDDRPVTGALVDADSGWRKLPVAPTRPGRHDVELVGSVDHFSGPIRLDLCVALESRSPS